MGMGLRGESFDPTEAFMRLETQASEVPGFTVRNRVVVGNFAFQKMAMVRDLQDCGDALAEHDLIAALAGDSGARETVLTARTEIDSQELDRTSPEREFLVVDADSSQQRVVAAVLADQD